jgi:aminocarboxymuconate-semialdehyde decarboxylase
VERASPRMIVNHQAHWYPPAYIESVVGNSGFPRATKLDGGRYLYEMGDEPGAWRFEIATRFTDIDEQVAAMDAAGIGMAALNPNMVGEVDRMELARARETIAFLNEETARVQRRFPDRIAGLCMLPTQDAEASLEALDRAVELDLRGVLMVSNIAGRPLGEESTWPIFERIDELGLPIFLHPASNSMLYDRGLVPVLDWSAGWLYDTSVAALTIILNGILDRCPNLEIVHPHLGGIVPYNVGRTTRYAGYLQEPIEHPVEHYLRTRFYIDIVTQTPAAIPLAVETYGADRLLFGDDYPWHLHEESLRFIDEHLGQGLAEAVLHRNRVATLRLA